MTRLYRILTLAAALMATVATASAQPFSVEAYRQFLERNASLTPEGLETLHPIGSFESAGGVRFDDARFADSIDRYYALTPYERELIGRNGFMVTERQTWRSFGDALMEIYGRDLPVFVSTDAILHAVHMSYDRILRDVEEYELIPRLDSVLTGMRGALPTLAERYRSEPAVLVALGDADVYLTIAQRLLNRGAVPVFPHSGPQIEDLLEKIAAESPANVQLFGESPRPFDFSQFTPRGHYTQTPGLTAYFKAMIWLGRAEIYLTKPVADVPRISDADIHRQTILAAVLSEALHGSGSLPTYQKVEQAIASFVGEQDNATIEQVAELMQLEGIADARGLFDEARWRAFQERFRKSPYAQQRILSQMLVRNPMSPPLEPAGALMLFGQRFIIDSYVLGNVVWDKLEEKRMLPSSLDALFALGNNAALQLLEPELVKYRYAPQLAALRHLIDGYDAADWQSSIYASWLDGIRALNPPAERESLPRFMQTAAYWQQKMNTQLASWAQLRHDNLLYAKQSYSGMPGCSFPKSLVEPIPDFYVALGRLAERASTALTRLDFRSTMHARGFFTRMGSIADTLETIARKELRHEELSSAEQTFLERMLFMAHKGCVEVPDGWYAELFYDSEGNDLVKEDYVVADVHTAPADENGQLVGWVMHVGTGPLNMAVVTCTRPDGETYSYVGPVMSYYERVTGNFQRLTDEAWKEEWKAPQSARPSWVNLYLADRTGGPRDGATHLRFAGVDESGAATPSTIRTSVHPNPTHESVTIEFNIPQAVANEHVTVEIFDNAGARVRTLVAEPLPAGDYAIRWDGRDEGGAQVAAATYHYRVKVASAEASGSISYLPQR